MESISRLFIVKKGRQIHIQLISELRYTNVVSEALWEFSQITAAATSLQICLLNEQNRKISARFAGVFHFCTLFRRKQRHQ